MSDQMTDQAPTPSVEERAANLLFGTPPKKQQPPPVEAQAEPETQEAEPSEGTEATTEEAPTAEETFEFDADGVKYALPKQLERHVQNMRDYTQKSQVIADQRRTFEALNEQAK